MNKFTFTLLRAGVACARPLVAGTKALQLLLVALLAVWGNTAAAAIQSPSPGSTLPGSSVTFSWTPIPDSTVYVLALGSAPEVLSGPPWGDLGLQPTGTGTNATFLNLPQNGNPVYGRLWYTNVFGQTAFVDYVWQTDATGKADVPAMLVSPQPSETVTSGTFLSWDAGRGVANYKVTVASSPEIISGPPWADLFSWSGTATSISIPHLPSDGSPVYVRLWSQIQDKWLHKDYTFATEVLTAANILQPQAGVHIGNTSFDFQWDGVPGASEYWLFVATDPDMLQDKAGDIFIGSTAENSLKAYNIPLDGEEIYVRLWTRIGSVSLFNDYQFPTQKVVPAELVSPSTYESLGKHAQKFVWNQGSGATDYMFAIATGPESSPDNPSGDIFFASTKDKEVVAAGLPLDGSDVYVRLWSMLNGEWFYRDSVFQTAVDNNPPDMLQECTERGWEHVQVDINGKQRQLLAKGASSPWTRGVIILLHGGGGNFTNWCGSSESYYQSQFAADAIAQGYAVIALDSTDETLLDELDQNCGKRFDAVAETQENIDLSFVSWVLDDFISSQRPADVKENIFVVGHSNGGYMATRIATHFDDRITAFVPVAAGDPYGTRLHCDETLGTRPEAPGIFIDRETRLNISKEDACLSPSYPNELVWDTSNPETKPRFMLAYHANDGVVDKSCMEKLNAQLVEHGYPETDALILTGGEQDPDAAHHWQPEYNKAIIDFFNISGPLPGC